MITKNSYTFFCILFISTFAFGQSKQQQVIFKFTNGNDSLQQKAFVKQMENQTDHWTKENIEVVFYNLGVELAISSNMDYILRLKNLHQKGGRFVICENTLKNRKKSKDKFESTLVENVPEGIS